MKTTMISLKSHRYGRGDYIAGDAFEADNNDIKMLTVLGRAKVGEQKYQTRVMVPEVAIMTVQEPSSNASAARVISGPPRRGRKRKNIDTQAA